MSPVMRTPTTELIPEPDLLQMERWTAWVIRLTAHAASQATHPGIRERLERATDDAESLRGALAAATDRRADADQIAIARSVYELWDANHDRTERLAAVIDPIWHRRWRMRTAGARPERLPTAIEHPLVAVD